MSKKGLSILGQSAISPQDAAFLNAAPEVSSQQFLRAVLEDQLEEVAKMIVHDDRLVKSRDASGASALLLAVYHGLEEMAGVIRRAEVPLDFAEAVAVADLARVDRLLAEDPARLHEATPDGFTALVLAAWLGHRELAERLLERGADPGRPAINATAMTPLHAAAGCRRSEESLAISRLLLDRGAPLEAIEAGGFTPLHLASAQGNRELVLLLLERGADPMAASDTDATALELAAERGFNDIVRLLERHAASLA
jgi:ankyrin repeat protein